MVVTEFHIQNFYCFATEEPYLLSLTDHSILHLKSSPVYQIFDLSTLRIFQFVQKLKEI